MNVKIKLNSNKLNIKMLFKNLKKKLMNMQIL